MEKLAVSTQTRTDAIVYPDSDGQRMSDNTLQFQWIMTIVGGLQALFTVGKALASRRGSNSPGASFGSSGLTATLSKPMKTCTAGRNAWPRNSGPLESSRRLDLRPVEAEKPDISMIRERELEFSTLRRAGTHCY